LKIIHNQNISTNFKEAKISTLGLARAPPMYHFAGTSSCIFLTNYSWMIVSASAKGLLHVKIKASTFHTFKTDSDCLTVLWKNFHILWAVLYYVSDCTL